MKKFGNNIKGIDWNTDEEVDEIAEFNGVIKEEGISKGMPSYPKTSMCVMQLCGWRLKPMVK